MVDKKSNQVIYCSVEEKEYLKVELEKYRLRKKAESLGLSISAPDDDTNTILDSSTNTSISNTISAGISRLLGSSGATPREYFYLAMCIAKGNTRSGSDWGRFQSEVRDMPEERVDSFTHYLTRSEIDEIEKLTTELFGPKIKSPGKKQKSQNRLSRRSS